MPYLFNLTSRPLVCHERATGKKATLPCHPKYYQARHFDWTFPEDSTVFVDEGCTEDQFGTRVRVIKVEGTEVEF